MADELESEIGDATGVTDETLLKELNSTLAIQDDEVFSHISQNIDTQSVCELEKTLDSSGTEDASYKMFSNEICTFQNIVII